MAIITVSATGTQVTSGVASANAAIPNNASGSRAKRVRVTAATASGFAYIRPGQSGVTAAVTDLPVNFGAPVDLNVGPFTHIAYIEGSTGCKINITPLEDY